MQTSKFEAVLVWVDSQLKDAEKKMKDNSHKQSAENMQASIKSLREKKEAIVACDVVAQAEYAALVKRLQSQDRPVTDEDRGEF